MIYKKMKENQYCSNINQEWKSMKLGKPVKNSLSTGVEKTMINVQMNKKLIKNINQQRRGVKLINSKYQVRKKECPTSCNLSVTNVHTISVWDNLRVRRQTPTCSNAA